MGTVEQSSSIQSVIPNLFTGKVSMSIPIDLPTAGKGMSPNLALVYQNIGSNGLVGVGWDLPISAVERNFKFGVDLNGNDYVLELNGSSNELVNTSGNEYRSKIEGGFFRVRLLTDSNNQKSWEVTDPSGTRYFFGRNAASRQDNPANAGQILRWCLDRIEDTHGNFSEFSYTKINGEGQIYLARIDYAGNAAIHPLNHVKFNLEPRSDTYDSFFPNFRVRTSARLKSVEVFSSDNLVGRYELKYDVDSTLPDQQYSPSTGRSLLTEVTKYGSDGKTSVRLMSITYPNHTGGYRNPDWVNGPSPSIPVGNQCFSGDFNGDGKSDITCYTGSGGNWHTVVSTGNGWQSINGSGGPAPAVPVGDQCFIGDFNGDGKSDMTCYTGSSGNWHTVVSTGNGWQSIDGSGGPAPGVPVGNQCTTGDFNGDGKTDLTCYTGSGGNYKMALSTGNGWSSPTWSNGPSPAVPTGNQCLGGDFNGDGKSDFTCFTGSSGSWQMALSDGAYPDLIESFQNSLGGVTKLTYASSANYANTQLQFPLQTISAIESSDGRGGTTVTHFSFSGGFYQLSEREFRGFNSVTVTGPEGPSGEKTITQMWFHQGNDLSPDVNDPSKCIGVMKGKPYRTEVRDEAGNIYFKTLITYAGNSSLNCDVSAAGPYFNPPQQVDSFTCNGSSCNGAKQTQVVYAYDSFGNIVREEQHGDVNDQFDDFTVTRSYSPNLGAWILNLPSNETVYAGIGTSNKIVANDYYYDGIIDCNGASTNKTPTKGDLTAIVWLNSEAESPEAHFAYDGFGNLICSKDPKGNKTTIAYDSSHTFPISVTDAKKLTTKFEYYGVGGSGTEAGSYGQLKMVTDASGAATKIEYDTLGRERKTIRADGSFTSVIYNNIGNPVDQNIQVTTDEFTTWIYSDGLGRTWITKSTGPDQKTIAVQRTFDARGFVKQISLPYFEGVDSPVWKTYRYDSVGRLIAVTNSDQTARQLCYKDWVTSVLDENGHRLRVSYNAFGRALRVQEYEGTYKQCSTESDVPLSDSDRQTLQQFLPSFNPNTTVVPYSTTNYRYDVLGHVVSVTDTKNNEIELRYNSLGQKTLMRDPDLGTWKFFYDRNGNLERQEDAKNQVIHYQYDSINRLQQKDYTNKKPLGSGDVIYTYDVGGSHGAGRLTAMKDISGKDEYFYDILGRMVQTNKLVDSKKYTLKASYDVLNRLSSISYPDNSKISYAYNGPFLSKIFDAHTMYASYSDYIALGEPTTVTFGNGITTNYSYSNFNNPECMADNYRPCTVSISNKDGALYSRVRYFYDAVGNVNGIADQSFNHRSFVYDAQDRLVAEGVGNNHSGTAQSLLNVPPTSGFTLEKFQQLLQNWDPNVSWKSTYVYDEIGNITFNPRLGTYKYLTTGTGGTSHPHSPTTAGNHDLQYDDNGNLKAGMGRVYSYDLDNRPTRIERNGTVTTFVYDAAGQRVKKITGQEKTTYVGDLYACTSGKKCKKFVFQGANILAQVTAGQSNPLYYSLNHLGSPTLVTNSDGSVNQKIEYNSYGELTSDSAESNELSHLFTGKEFDASTDLYYFQARYYDPQMCRFISPDSVEGLLLNPQSFNRYTYVYNNPLNYIDPTGQYADEDGGGDDGGDEGGDGDGGAGGNGGYGGEVIEPKDSDYSGNGSTEHSWDGPGGGSEGSGGEATGGEGGTGGAGGEGSGGTGGGSARNGGGRGGEFAGPRERDGSDRGSTGRGPDPDPRADAIEPTMAPWEIISTARAAIGLGAVAFQASKLGVRAIALAITRAPRMFSRVPVANGTRALTVTFGQFGHGARHMLETGIPSQTVESAITAEVRSIAGGASRVGPFWGRITIEETVVEYRAHPVGLNRIHVGTHYPVR
jgi:RHS repeat-associated protein